MSHGEFVWYELATTDAAAARAFYADILGWSAEEVPGMDYTLLKAGDARVAGLMTLPDEVRERGVPPHWIAYIAVEHVDQSAERAQKAGAILRHGPADIPGIGRFAIMTDPQHAPFCLFSGMGEAPPTAGPAPGHVGWRELRTTDGNAAFDFYADLFGWTKGEAIDMGPMGTYQIFNHGGAMRGGIMTGPQGAHPSWLIYFNVEKLDVAAQRVPLAGGMIVQGATEIPGGAWIAQLRDPQGADFALVAPTR